MRFLAATGVSSYGDWLSTVALMVVLYRLTRSATGPALYMVVRVGVRLIGPFPGGVLADRFRPARVAAACSAGQGVACVLLVSAVGRSQLVPIYVLVGVAQLLGSMVRPCAGAVISGLVGDEALERINSWYSGISGSALLVAPALGALLLHWVSPGVLVGLDAASFVVAAVGFMSLPQVARAASRHPSGALAGLRAVWADSALRALIVAALCASAATTTASALFVVAAAQRFHSAGAVGILYGAAGVGGLLGSAFAGWRPSKVFTKMTVIAASSVEVGALVLFALAPTVVVAACVLALGAAACDLYMVWGDAAVQRQLPAELIGRAFAGLSFASFTGMLIGAVAAVILGPVLGWAATIASVGVVSAAVLLVMSIPQVEGCAVGVVVAESAT